MPILPPLVARLAIAALVGLAVGIERERSGHAAGPSARFAGVRTFLLLGGVGGVAGWLQSVGFPWTAGALVIAAGALVTGAYVSTVRSAGVDGTTEVAAILVVGLGMLAGIGELSVASGAGAVTVLALSEKATIHRVLERLGATELRAALYFSVFALVILPILPDRAIGPFGGVNPRALWIVVLLFSGINFAGYVARRVVGPSRGYGVTGAMGGLISSTAVTLGFARQSRVMPELAGPLGVGTVAASVVLLARVLVVSALLNAEVAVALLPYLVFPLVAGALLVGWWLWRRRLSAPDGADAVDADTSPLGFRSALVMTVVFQAALTAIELIRSRFGSRGVIASAAMLGLTDMDALTLAMSRLGRTDGVGLAALAIAVGVLSNAVIKLALASLLGTAAYRRIAGAGLLLLAASSALAIAIAR